MTPTAVGRWMRPAAAFVLLPLLLISPSAHAAGTGGISVTPIPALVDGKTVTSFRVTVPREGTEQVPFTVSNIEAGPRTARLYVAEVTRVGDEFRLGAAGTSPFAAMPDRQVTLQGGEAEESHFVIDGSQQPDGQQLAAVVVEVTNGAVTTQASTLIYLEPADELPLPLLLVGLAVLLVVAAGSALAVVARRRTAPALPHQ